MNKVFVILAILITPTLVWAQKKALSHQDYDQWKSISNYNIGEDGAYIYYEINPQQGNGILYLYNTRSGKTKSFERGANAKLSYQGSYLVFVVKPIYNETREAKRKKKKKDEMPKKHVVILNLTSGATDTIKNASSFSMPKENEGWLAIKLDDAAKKKSDKKEDKKETPENTKEEEKLEKDKKSKQAKTPKNRVLVRTLDGLKSDTLNFVSEFHFAVKTPKLIYAQAHKEADSIKGVYVYEDKVIDVLDSAGTVFSKIAIDESGVNMAWLSTQDSAKAEVKIFTLNVKNTTGINSIDTNFMGMPSHKMVSQFYQPRFSKDGKHLFVELRKIPVAIEKDTMELEEEKVSLDIWSWTDTIIQPAQLKGKTKQEEKGYLAVYHIGDKKLVSLESASLQNVSYNKFNITKWLVGKDNRAVLKSLSWNYPTAEDVIAINVNTGERKLLVSGLKGHARLSPAGHYIYGYDKEASAYFAIDIENGKTLKLNNFKEPVWNVENDIPALAGSYGIAGWSENDKAIFIYSQFNIWRVDLADATNPKRITDQEKDNPIRYRYKKLDNEEQFLPKKMVLHAFEENTKREGYYTLLQDGTELKEVLPFEDVHYTGFIKAKKTENIVFRKGNFVDYTELYSLKKFQSEPVKISETNPQQKEYNWARAELVHWKGKKGVGNLDGLLIKPENFDENKKYPILIYFYERYSDLLNYHFGFKPSASTINFAYFASNGYVIFIPDIVYEEGHPGNSAYNCVVSGAEWLAKKPWVDETKMAIQGQSWGGYQVAYLVTKTDMFACAMAGAPVSNMTSAYGGIRWGSGWSREFQYEKTQSRLGGTLWDSRDLYIENSPVFFADKVNTPLLMMHNDNDGAVPWYQGIEYFMALRRLNKPTWLLVYNKEAHNLKKRHNRKDLSIRMGQFFDYYLKGEPAPEWMKTGRKAILKELNKAY